MAIGRVFVASVLTAAGVIPAAGWLGTPADQVTAAVGGVTQAAAATTARYVALGTPERLIDSRQGLGTVKAPLAAGTSRDLQITGGIVPADATAVMVNVTAANVTGTGWLQVLPTGRAEIGSSSTLNIEPAVGALPAAAFAPLGDGGRITVYATFSAEIVVDVFGYFVPAASATAGRYVGLTPARLLDTRQRLLNPGDAKDCGDFVDYGDAKDWYDAFAPLFGDVARLDDDADGIPCETLVGAPAPAPPSATAAPTTTAPPTAPSVGAPPTVPPTVAPATTAGSSKPADPGNTKNCGDFPDYASAKAWFDLYFPWYGDVAQLDADDDGIPCEGLQGAPKRLRFTDRVPRNTTLTLPVAGQRGVPTDGVGAVVLNVTAVEPTATGYVQVAPTPVVPGRTSNLNTSPGVTVANLVVVPLGAQGTVDLYTYGPTDLVVDVLGWFTDGAAPSSTAGLFVAVTPDRRLDTRRLGPAPAGPHTETVDVSSISATAAALAATVTATEAETDGWVQVAATPVNPGASSNLNVDLEAQTIANAVVTPVTGGRIDVHTSRRSHLLVDVTGWFTDGSPLPTGAPTATTVPATTLVSTTTTSAGPSAEAALALGRLAALGTTAGPAPVPYDRDEWEEGIDADGDCQRTRHEVLVAEADGPLTFSADGCSVVSGTWHDPYTGTTLTLATQIEVDHLVALSEAHESGGWAWDAAAKRAFANDLTNPETLVAVAAAANQAKSNLSPDQWLPTNTAHWCTYAQERVTVKFVHALTVTTAERAALVDLLEDC